MKTASYIIQGVGLLMGLIGVIYSLRGYDMRVHQHLIEAYERKDQAITFLAWAVACMSLAIVLS